MINDILTDVFSYKKGEKVIIIYDIPTGYDTKEWASRRRIAKKWFAALPAKGKIASYKATYANNADLPEKCIVRKKEIHMDKIMSNSDIVIALTQFSATAPLHKYAKKYGLRVASMPGFNKKMLPAMELSYRDIASKVGIIYKFMARAKSARILFRVRKKDYQLNIDLRECKPKKDDGNCKKNGCVINLPSGEAFIVPNETNMSRTKGFLPIQKSRKVFIYEVQKNHIIGVRRADDGLLSKIIYDPAVGNIAELAFGVLGFYGIRGCGAVLLDEKLGLHIALGRSEHLGGITSPKSFRLKKNVWHQDFVYTKQMQPMISVKEARLFLDDSQKVIIKDDKYVIF
jgi:leucyl aminopeptidase (aminopeptidase T)